MSLFQVGINVGASANIVAAIRWALDAARGTNGFVAYIELDEESMQKFLDATKFNADGLHLNGTPIKQGAANNIYIETGDGEPLNATALAAYSSKQGTISRMLNNRKN